MALHKAPVLAAIGLTLCLAHPSLAQIARTPMGAVNATIDGTPYSGKTLDVPSEGTSTAEFRSFGPVTSLSIQAHDPEADNIMRNILTIEVSLMGSDASASIIESSVSWWPEGMGEPFYLSEDSGTSPEVDFDVLSLEGGATAAQGAFSAVVCRRDEMFADVDMNDCRLVKGTFDTALGKAD